MKRTCFSLVASVAFAALFCGASPTSAQSLGNAQSYAVLGGTSVTAAGTGTVITGDVGVSPGTSITGFPAAATVVAPFGTHANDGAAIAAQSSVTSLYTTLASTGGATPIVAELGGVQLTPGTYSFSSTANIAANQTLTLSGGGTYIFKVGSAITANVGSRVSLINGASACNVFWQVTSAATLNGVSFAGTVVAQAGVTLGVGAALSGRALTTAAGAVTLSGGNTVGGCSAAGGGCPTITLSPATLPGGTQLTPYSQTITGSGGAVPYTFTVTSGTLPAGLTLTSAGVLAGTPTSAGTSTFTIRGTDANGCFATLSYTIIIAAGSCPAITLAPATPPNGTQGVAYSQTITGSGGTAPYTFAVAAGALPGGLTLSAAGVLSGTPTTVGVFPFTVRGTDAVGCFAELTYTIAIVAAPVPGCPAITLSPATLPGGTRLTPYSQTITGSGGTAPYTFAVAAGALPGGLTLSAAGVLSGTPTTAGVFPFTVRGTDALGCFRDLAYTITIVSAAACPPITISPAALPNIQVGVSDDHFATISGSGGTAPYTFTVTAGALPAGLVLSPGGGLSGKPTTAGLSTFTVRGTDAVGCFAELPYTIAIVANVPCPPIALSPATLPNGTQAVAYSQTITGSGGTAPYTFAVTAGALPAGLTLSAAGVLSGTPTVPGPYTFTVVGTDKNGCLQAISYTIIITSPVPTLSQWGASLLAAGLLGLGYLRLRRRSAGAARTS